MSPLGKRIGTPEWRAGVEWAIRLAKQHGARYQRNVGDPRPFAELLQDKADEVPRTCDCDPGPEGQHTFYCRTLDDR